jgi:chromosome segregation protein
MARTLTRIRIHGFKTFAQRVEIELAHDLVAVVGPNGCGKSNLVDAIVWALGEVSVRALRAAAPTEVLFNGSATEKPLGMAEVSLWFDNESRWLPLDVDEVQITRRLYRSGEWECWINRTPARLRDVADLFAGTGLGRGGYAIVGQGEIEAFLSADPEERRQWLEELAGIAFYRNRRRDALRDLETARLHIQRVEDVLRELERGREPLREQAERALLYRQLQAQLRQMERQLLLQDRHALHTQLRALNEERQGLREAIERAREQNEHAETQAETYGKEVARFDAEIETLRTLLQSQQSAEERLQGDLKALHERERTLGELAQTLQDEARALGESETRHTRTIALLQARQQTARAALTQILPRLQEAQAITKAQEAQRQALEARYRAALQAKTEREAYARQQLALEARMQALMEQKPHLEHQLQEATEAVHAARQREAQLRNALDSAQAHLTSIDAQLAAYRTQYAERRARREQLQARAQALAASLQAGEGASPPVRRLLQAAQAGELQGEFYPVGSILTVPAELQLAIEAALGGSINDLITPTEADARTAIEWLKQTRAGRLTFLPLDLLPEPNNNGGRASRRADTNALSPHRGEGWGEGSTHLEGEATHQADKNARKNPAILGFASELVRYDARFERAIQHLLGRTLVVETLEAATRLLRTKRMRMVTLDGELIQPSGALTGGRQHTERSSLLALKRQLDETRQEAEALEKELQTDESTLRTLQAQHDAARAQVEQLQRELHEAVEARLAAEAAHAQATRAYTRWQQEWAQLQKEQAHIEAQLRETDEPDLDALQAERDTLMHAHAEALQTLATLQAEHERLQRELDETEARLQQEAQQLQTITQRKAQLEQRVTAIEGEREQIQQERTQHQAELSRLRSQIEQTQQHLDALRAERQRYLEQSLAWSDAARTARQSLQQLLERDRALELQTARLEVRLNDINEQWQRLFPDEPFPTDEPPEPQRIARSEVEKLRRTLQAMGEVNLGAAEEYARLTERINTLLTQREDLLKTYEQLERALHEIDLHARQRFEETFEAARVTFNERFQQLFEGGHADLVLTNPRDPLSAGVLIEAQPPNKRRQRLELLSGGERALTATALLLAFMQVKPSPLCVLDEVDAALDGRNVQRFADHLKEMAQRTQVIIVTHNPITTAVAGQWIGVSMTGGVSRLVPYVPRVSDSETDGLDRRRAVIHLQSQPTPTPTTPPSTQPPSTSEG